MIPGVQIVEDAISQEYADWILSLLPQEFLKQAHAIDRSSGSASLQMHHFAPLPDYISMISEDVIPLEWKARIWSGEECDSSIVQAYQAGEGIRWHVDLMAFGDGVAILSLLSTVTMKFRRVADHSVEESFILKPNSLLLCAGVARYDWEHSIAEVNSESIEGELNIRKKRISITMRRMDKVYTEKNQIEV